MGILGMCQLCPVILLQPVKNFKLDGTHQLLVYDNINTKKDKTEALIGTSKEIGLQVK
jgi:hypothetical protein